MIARRRLARVFGRTTGPGSDSEIGLLSLYGCDQQTRLVERAGADQVTKELAPPFGELFRGVNKFAAAIVTVLVFRSAKYRRSNIRQALVDHPVDAGLHGLRDELFFNQHPPDH